ncbi:MAG: phage tail tube protein, partial [Alphaproteobacteria bacterium]
ATGRILEASFDLLGKDALRGTASFGTGDPIAAGTDPVMNAVGNVVLVREGGGAAGIIRQMTVQVDNNLRELKAVGSLGNVGIGVGDASVGGTLEAYFEDGALYDKYLAGTDTSLAFVVAEGGRAYVVTLPRAKLTQGRIDAGSRNADCVLRFELMARRDPATGASIQIDRLPEFGS